MASVMDANACARVLGESSLTLQIRCDLVDTLVHLRPACRIMVQSGDEAERAVRLIVGCGFSVSVARGVVWQPSRGGVVDWRSTATANTVPFVVLYCSTSQEAADRARMADETRDDATFGETLGYPVCCVAFVTARGRVPEHREVFALYAPDGKYDPTCWPGAMAADASLLIHYPCSVECERSRAMAAARWHYLRQFAPEAVVARVQRAHSISYWLSSEQRVLYGDLVPADRSISAAPSTTLT